MCFISISSLLFHAKHLLYSKPYNFVKGTSSIIGNWSFDVLWISFLTLMHWQVNPNEKRKQARVNKKLFSETILLTLWNLKSISPILQTALPPISFCQRSSNLKSKYRIQMKMLFPRCWWNWTNLDAMYMTQMKVA